MCNVSPNRPQHAFDSLGQRVLNVDIDGVDQWADGLEGSDRYDRDKSGKQAVLDHVLSLFVSQEFLQEVHEPILSFREMGLPIY